MVSEMVFPEEGGTCPQRNIKLVLGIQSCFPMRLIGILHSGDLSAQTRLFPNEKGVMIRC